MFPLFAEAVHGWRGRVATAGIFPSASHGAMAGRPRRARTSAHARSLEWPADGPMHWAACETPHAGLSRMVSCEMARAIANMAVFLELSPDSVLDADASLQALEQLAADLQRLDGASREKLSAMLRFVASEYDGEARTFVENLPDSLGIR